MTSSDVIDTAFALQIQDSAKIILKDLSTVIGTLKKLANEFLESNFGGKNAGKINSSSDAITTKNTELNSTSSTSGTNLHALDRNIPSDDWDCCKCANPEDRDFYCTKCGKISKGFAPHVDKEFEQMLKRRK